MPLENARMRSRQTLEGIRPCRRKHGIVLSSLMLILFGSIPWNTLQKCLLQRLNGGRQDGIVKQGNRNAFAGGGRRGTLQCSMGSRQKVAPPPKFGSFSQIAKQHLWNIGGYVDAFSFGKGPFGKGLQSTHGVLRDQR
jgi:hypothetical protein